MIRAKSNVQKLIKSLGRFETAKRFAAHETLNNVAEFAKNEAARGVRDSKYSTLSLKQIKQKMYADKRGSRDRDEREWRISREDDIDDGDD